MLADLMTLYNEPSLRADGQDSLSELHSETTSSYQINSTSFILNSLGLIISRIESRTLFQDIVSEFYKNRYE